MLVQSLFLFCLFSESSIPIDCTKSPGRNYNCPGGVGSPCLDGPSMLCDLKPDCPNAGDEKEPICGQLLVSLNLSIKHFLIAAFITLRLYD